MSDAAAQVVLVETRGPVKWVFINRIERRNALNEQVANGIIAAIEDAEADPECRAIVLTGAGDKAFCAGGDLAPSATGAPFTVNPADPRNFVVRMLKRMSTCTLPIIARVNGPALAGGLGLMCACDMAVSSSTAKFGTPESGIGLFPAMIMPTLQRVLPLRKLYELCITGELFTADEALAMDLVNYVVPPEELDAKVEWLLGRITNKSPTAIRLGKIGFQAVRDMTLNQAYEFGQLMLPTMAQTEDCKEGFAAFQQKRKPNWPGK
jgi:enoyl-CoA hydratase/carnithine racemase